MSDRAFELAMARAHVIEFEARVDHQETLTARLAEDGRTRDVEEACRVLGDYRERLDLARDHLRRLQGGPSPVDNADREGGVADCLLRDAAS